MRLALIALLALCGGCVSYDTDLINNKGEHTACSGWAFGWATPIEMAMHHDCMVKAQKAGYHAAGQPQTAAN
jgi:hypothetical protein